MMNMVYKWENGIQKYPGLQGKPITKGASAISNLCTEMDDFSL